jgi:energy-coupling factor transporter ATP-binding protein EcfA2
MSQQPIGFRKATREAVKARIALAGPTGSGKTYTALVIAAALVEADGGRMAFIDTEKESNLLYANEFDYDYASLGPPYSPQRYVAAIHAAEEAGYTVLVVDSLSHAWSDEGGVLSIVDDEVARTKSGNSFAAWRKGTPEQNRLVNALVQSPIHVVATMRTKMAYALEKDERTGRQQVRKLGLEPVQRENIEYEFAVVGELDLDHRLMVTKSRLAKLQDRVVLKPGLAFGRELVAELRDGVREESAPNSKPVADAVPAEVADSSDQDVPPNQAPAGTPTSEGEEKGRGVSDAPLSPKSDSAPSDVPLQDDGTPATDAQWALVDQHHDRVNSAKVLQAARKLFPEADIRSKSQITKVQFEKAFWAVMDRSLPAEEEEAKV